MRMARSVLPAGAALGATLLTAVGPLPTGVGRSGDPVARAASGRPIAAIVEAVRDPPSSRYQEYPHYPYDGSWTFARIRTRGGGYGGWGRRRRGGGGWAHDYPYAERNFAKIVDEFTEVDARLEQYGGNVFTFDDPELLRYPIAYVSEPDEWRTTPEEAEALRQYLLKGGFVIFDDFYHAEMANLVFQMELVFPELTWMRLDGTEEIWDAFFSLVPGEIYLRGPNKEGTPHFYGLYEDNDKSGRMLAVAGAGADIGDLWEWSDRGYFPIDPTNEAYWIGINYVIYALTH